MKTKHFRKKMRKKTKKRKMTKKRVKKMRGGWCMTSWCKRRLERAKKVAYYLFNYESDVWIDPEKATEKQAIGINNYSHLICCRDPHQKSQLFRKALST